MEARDGPALGSKEKCLVEVMLELRLKGKSMMAC